MTMTANEERLLRNYVARPHPTVGIYAVVAALASVALKEAATKAAQASSQDDPPMTPPPAEMELVR